MHKNTQPAERQIRGFNNLEVHSIFHTIQGEGPFCGTPAVFIRLAGCNLQCPFCDTEYTDTRLQMTVLQIMQSVGAHAKKGLVVITGGEPFRQDISFLVDSLCRCGYYVQVETNGTLPPSPAIVWQRNYWKRSGAYIVCAPKTAKINPVLADTICALKYVVKHDQMHTDGLPTKVLDHPCETMVARPPHPDITVYVQPCDSKDAIENKSNLQAAIQSCMTHGYVLQLQVHKLIDME